MDRVELSSAIIQEMQALVGEALEGMLPELLSVDVATLEQRVQEVGRVLLGGLIERGAAGQAQGLPRPVRCTGCGGRLKRRERTRHLVGLGGTTRCEGTTIGVRAVGRAPCPWMRRAAWGRAASRPD